MNDTASAAPSDLDIDATWDALPGIRIHNDANARGLDTQTMLRRAFARAVLAKWGRPAVVKWEPEEIADHERGIRWVTNDGIHGRPTDHDVREYLERTPAARGCDCDECKQFFADLQPGLDELVALSEQAGLYEGDFPAKREQA